MTPGHPAYWMHEMSGLLAPVVEKYLAGRELNAIEVAAMRAYLRQWIAADVFYPRSGIDDLRRDVEQISSTDDIRRWLAEAADEGIDPL